jgi:hypothetical protein
MRKIILKMPVSGGGFIEGSERELDRHKAGDELPPPFASRFKAGVRRRPETCRALRCGHRREPILSTRGM